MPCSISGSGETAIAFSTLVIIFYETFKVWSTLTWKGRIDSMFFNREVL